MARLWPRFCAPIVASLVLLAFANVSQARGLGRGRLLFTVSKLQDVPSDKQQFVYELGESPAIGYMYSSFYSLFLDLWTWGGQYVVYSDEAYMELTPELAAELGVSLDDLGKPILYRFPSGLLAFTLLMVGGTIYHVMTNRKPKRRY